MHGLCKTAFDAGYDPEMLLKQAFNHMSPSAARNRNFGTNAIDRGLGQMGDRMNNSASRMTGVAQNIGQNLALN